ncbi:MAG TPA: prepilin-type N-terminal cleavage/methylation domain-containing protein [Phycisphaerales bacterium]|jgi:prepilin-type N-terminal cleavage/methylation domain-containing protein|nr:prepilin-type N-terminal cleavage/methylation domain-containing protein [Phycisphaerales bacterium]
MSRRRETTGRRGFTLMEVALALGISAILMLAMGGALMVTTSAVETASDSGAQALQAAGPMSQLGAELSVATQIYSTSPNDIYFTVPDRDGDGYPEEIEYTWNKPGSALLRSYQGAAPVPVIQSVQSLSLITADRKPATPVEGAETVLMSCDTPAGSTLKSDKVDTGHFQAQYVRPPMPANASSWKITRIKLFLSQTTGTPKLVRLSVFAADASLMPSTTVLASTTFASGSVPLTAGWVEYAIGPVAGLSPTAGVCIVVDSTDGDTKVYRVEGGANQPYNTHYMTSNSSYSWSTPNDTQDMKFILTGTITTLVEP